MPDEDGNTAAHLVPSIEGILEPEQDQNEEEQSSEAESPKRALTKEELCRIVEDAAVENALPPALFVRLIWQESRFRTHAVSPAGAKGIAQFMPGTAAERGLTDPFDPEAALPESASFLGELMGRFGNFGLAAAAYNGGPRRVREWLAGKGGLPKETREYVIHITGRPAEHWAEATTAALPDPEAEYVENCRVRPLRAAMAALREYRRAARIAATAEAAKQAATKATTSSAAKPATTNAAKQKTEAARESTGGWGVQLAGDWSEKTALATFDRLKKKYPKVLSKRQPTVVKTKLAGKGSATKTLVRIAADTRAEAEDLCKRLKEAGGSCVVLKNDSEKSKVAGS